VIIHDLLSRLDDSSFLGFRVWEFSLRSLRRRYGFTFLRSVALRHPLKTFSGVLRYRRLLRERKRQQDITPLFEGCVEDLVSRMVLGGRDLLVAVGFCQKPLEPPCPAGRPNHDCLYLDGLDLKHPLAAMHPACRRCDIQTIGTEALLAGANMHIMTSALDIAHDVMIPSIDRERFGQAIMCLCPYSVQAITLPLIICGIEGFLISYASGNCLDYQQWLLADVGIKREMTVLNPAAYDKVLTFLRLAAEHRAKEAAHYTRFVRDGNIYVPCE
jgi:hypothetical protein